MGIKNKSGFRYNHRNQTNQTNHSSDIMFQNNSFLKSLIDKLRNNFQSGGISNPLTDIEQIELFMSGKKSTDSRVSLHRFGFFSGYGSLGCVSYPVRSVRRNTPGFYSTE